MEVDCYLKLVGGEGGIESYFKFKLQPLGDFYKITKNLNAVSASKWVIISTPSDAGEAEPPIAGAFPCFEVN